jgi:hypothetical protein
MRNVTYRDLSGQEHAAIIVGHTPAGENLAICSDEAYGPRVRGPVKNSSRAAATEESWSGEGHRYESIGPQTLQGVVKRRKLKVVSDDTDELFLDY